MNPVATWCGEVVLLGDEAGALDGQVWPVDVAVQVRGVEHGLVAGIHKRAVEVATGHDTRGEGHLEALDELFFTGAQLD